MYTDVNGTVLGPNGAGLYPNASACVPAPWVGDTATWLFVGFFAASGTVLMYGVRWAAKAAKYKKAQVQARVDAAHEAGEEAVLTEAEERTSKFSRWMFTYIGFAVAAGVAAAVIVANAMQHKLTVPENDAVADSGNFLTPFGDVFLFFEDGMTVRIGQAVGAADWPGVGLLVKWSAVGGFACGLAGALFATAFTWVQPFFDFFVPLQQGATLPADCSLLPSSVTELQALARPYWILIAFSWPASFMQKAAVGVFMGTGETQNWAIANVTASAVAVALFFGLIDVLPHTTAVGVAAMAPGYVFVAITAVVFLQRKWRVQFALGSTSLRSTVGRHVGWRAATDGFALMLKDLALTVQASMTNMFAAQLGLGQQYQLGIFKTINGTFGYTPGTMSGSIFALMLAYTVRLSGSRMLGEGQKAGFVWFCRGVLNGAWLFGAVATAALLATSSGTPYYFASTEVCGYQEEACSKPTYDAIFRSIEPGYVLNACMALVTTVGAVLTAILYAALEFEFVRNTTLVAFFGLFLPASFTAFFAVKTVFAVQLAAALPVAAVTAVYAHRVYFVLFPYLMEGHSMSHALSSDVDATERREGITAGLLGAARGESRSASISQL